MEANSNYSFNISCKPAGQRLVPLAIQLQQMTLGMLMLHKVL